MQISFSPEIVAVVLVLFYVLAIGSAVEAILRARTAQGAIAWVVSLLTLPYLTVPLYLVLGRSRFDGYVRERQQIEALAERHLRDTRSELRDYRASDADAAFYRALQRLARLPTVRGNEVELLVDGYATFDSIEAGLRQAQHYVLFQFYILRDDALGQRLGAVLAERARAGLRVLDAASAASREAGEAISVAVNAAQSGDTSGQARALQEAREAAEAMALLVQSLEAQYDADESQI